MPVTRINGIKLDLGTMSDEALGALLSITKARQRRAENDAGVILEEVGRRTYERSTELMLPLDAA